MEWSKTNPNDEADATPQDRVRFDVIRTLSAVRQQKSATVKAMRDAANLKSTPTSDLPAKRIDIFSGHRRAPGEMVTGGSFLTAPKQDLPGIHRDKDPE